MSCVSTNEKPDFEVCLTYARYTYLGEESSFVRVLDVVILTAVHLQNLGKSQAVN